MRFHSALQLTVVGVLILGLTGCSSLGPRTITHDRFNYSSALADSWKNQLLLNIVKTRYLDLPIYLDIGQIVSGYTLETAASIGGGVFASGGAGSPGNNITLGGSARFADSPTITYTPLTGDRFLEGFLSPVAPAKVFSLLQAGYAADFILELSVNSLNGLRNQPVTLGSAYQADPEFFRVLGLLREIQDAGALGLRVERPTNGQPATVLLFRNPGASPELQAKIREVEELLGLTPGQSALRIVASPLKGGPGELAVATRSLLQLLAGLALEVEVPPKDLEEKLTPRIPVAIRNREPLFRVHSGPKPPEHAFVAVPYEGHWFWIARDDWRSKRTFSSILFLFTLANTGAPQNVPTLTIPTR